MEGNAALVPQEHKDDPRKDIVPVKANLSEDVPQGQQLVAANEEVSAETGKALAEAEEAPVETGKALVVAESGPSKELALAEEAPEAPREVVAREGKIRIGIIDASHLMESRARDIAESNLATEKGELSGFSGVLKRIWKYNLAREYYRQKEIASVKEKIMASGTGFIDTAGGDSDGKLHRSALGAIAERFTTKGDGMIHNDAGESVSDESENPELRAALKELVLKHGSDKDFDQAAFDNEKDALLQKHHGENFNLTHANNLLEVVKQIRAAIGHGESIEQLQQDLEIVIGQAKTGARTEAELSRADRMIEKLRSTKLGAMVNETTLALAVGTVYSVGAALSQRIASSKLAAVGSFGATAALGAGLAAMRESTNIKLDRAQHAREMAMGGSIDPENGRRRQEMQESVHETKDAMDLVGQINALYEKSADGKSVLKAGLTKADIDVALKALAEADARVRLSNTKKIDLLRYSSPAQVEQERFALDLARAKAKVDLRKFLEANPSMLSPEGNQPDASREGGAAPDPEGYVAAALAGHAKDFEGSLGQEIGKKDELFEKMRRRRMGKAAAIALGTGLVVGGTFQEAMAFANPNQQGLVESAFHEDAGAVSRTPAESLAKLLAGDPKEVSVPLHEVAGVAGDHRFQLPEGVRFVPAKDGVAGQWSLEDANGRVMAEHLAFDKSGALTPESQQALKRMGFKLHESSVNVAGQPETKHLSAKEWMARQKDVVTVERKAWLDNNTSHFDKNELQLRWGGERGTGIDKDGNYVFDVKHMVAGGSRHGELSADAQQLAREGKLEMILSASKDSQGQVLKVPVNPDGTVRINPNDQALAKFFQTHDGKAEFLGKYAEVAEVVKPAGEGGSPVEQVRILATHVGKGNLGDLTVEVPTSHAAGVTTFELPPLPDEPTAGPVVAGFAGRSPLEKLRKPDDGEAGDPVPALPKTPDRGPSPAGAAVAFAAGSRSMEEAPRGGGESGRVGPKGPDAGPQPPAQEKPEERAFRPKRSEESDASYYREYFQSIYLEFVRRTFDLGEGASYEEMFKRLRADRRDRQRQVRDGIIGPDDREFQKINKAFDVLNRLRIAEMAESETVLTAGGLRESEKTEVKPEIRRKADALVELIETKALEFRGPESELAALSSQMFEKTARAYAEADRQALAERINGRGGLLRMTRDREGRWQASVRPVERGSSREPSGRSLAA
jgi:hypothetical protein